MARYKIDYGIDLGTTNSAIASMANGKPKIIKSDDRQTDTTPSCVSFKKQVWVGLKAYNQLNIEAATIFREFSKSGTVSDKNTFTEFKRAMGTERTYFSPNMKREYTPEELSAEVLKKLKSYQRDDDILATVITIPMRFGQNQIDATRRAAELAGFQYIETLQEPIAASIAYGLTSRKTQGYWFGFDLGGGTFDAALMRVIDGIMKVEDTAGDTMLGGRDIDYAIVDSIFIPYLSEHYQIGKLLSNNHGRQFLREALKWIAEETKVRLSKESHCNVVTDEPIGTDDNGEEMELDIKITLPDFQKAVSPIYQRALNISNELLRKHNLQGSDLETVILVGGPTYCQSLRSMLKEQLSQNIDTSMDPMTCVSQGAALYASTRDIPINLQKRDNTKIQLTLHYADTTVETEESLGIKIERDNTIGDVPQPIFVELKRNDNAWSSGRIEICGDAEVVPLILNVGEANSFAITVFDAKGNAYPCEPSVINIIQGLKAAQQVISHSFCIEVALIERGKQRLVELKGLEKNKTLPAKGKGSFKTQIDMRPGNAKDVIKIPIYSGDHGDRALLNDWAGTIEITGEDFDKFLPKDSEMEITIHVDSTQYIRLSAYFPYIDETISKKLEPWTQKKFDSREIERELSNAHKKLGLFGGDSGLEEDLVGKLQLEVRELIDLFENGRGNYDDERKVEERLRDVLKSFDKLEEEREMPQAKEELKETLNDLLVNNQRYGSMETTRVVEEYQKKVQQAMELRKDVRIIQDLNDDIQGFIRWRIKFQDIGFLVGIIKFYDDKFESIRWENSATARKLINDAKDVIVTNPSKKELQSIYLKLYNLLPYGPERFMEHIDSNILGY